MSGAVGERSRKRLLLVLTVLWMVLIFCMSAQPADASTETSLRAGRFAAGILIPGFHQMTEEEQREIAVSIDHPVRKTAHAAEYTVLGVLLYLLLAEQAGPAAAFGTGAVYAVTDELHQLFVPGRACMVQDMLLDSTGVLLGCLLAAGFSLLAGKKLRHFLRGPGGKS